ncbi:hypothetical protein G3I40_14540 [Streptomyces sp. SID14478]|uniref:hypothetical protein n=1 Tax=Streptomyces sp. SID14478 TaxID=2706073 RepID=UPI0013DCBF07|nr:hypothetical protein [Streptomyces sp. SID14478]NEB76432.1 hypothetical protein [Streptomyces sp. SID14478]
MREQNQFRFTLSFSLIDCARCGISRIRGVSCADCNASPAQWELDGQTARRRTAVQAAKEALEIVPSPLPAAASLALNDIQELIQRLQAWMPQFFAALHALSRGDENAVDDARSAAEAIAAEHYLLKETPRHRPWISIVARSEGCVACMVQMVHGYLCAMEATTSLEAQRQADTAQQQLDSAAERLAAFSDELNFMELLLSTDPLEGQLAHLLRQAMQQYSCDSVLDLNAAAERTLKELVGRAPAPGHSLGLQFSLQNLAMEVYSDGPRFRSLVADSFTLFSQDPERLSALASDPAFLPDVQAAVLELFDASVQAKNAARTPAFMRQAGRALVDLNASLVEGPGQITAIALLLAGGHKSRPYRKLRQEDATAVLKSARSHTTLRLLLHGFDLDLRNAQAHRMTRYVETGVTFETRTASSHVSRADLVDCALAACESSLGCLLGMLLALAQEGVGFDAGGYQALGVSADAMAAAMLTVQGCVDVVVHEDSDAWHVVLTAPPSQQLMTLVAGVGTLLPDFIKTMTLEAQGADRIRLLTGPTALLHAFSRGDVDGDNFGIATIRMYRTWTIDGTPCIDQATVRRWTAHQVGAVSPFGTEHNPVLRLRSLRALARELDDTALVEALTGEIRFARLGNDAGPSAIRSKQQMAVWAAAPVEWNQV